MPIGASVAPNDRYMQWAWIWRKQVWLGEKWSIVGEKKLNHAKEVVYVLPITTMEAACDSGLWYWHHPVQLSQWMPQRCPMPLPIAMTTPSPKLTPVLVPGTAAPCPSWILGRWAGPATSEVEWSSVTASVCDLYCIVLLLFMYYYILLLLSPDLLILTITIIVITLLLPWHIIMHYCNIHYCLLLPFLLLHCYYIIIIVLLLLPHSLCILHFVSLHCYYIIIT